MNIAEPKVKAAYSLGLGTRRGQVITHGFICLSVTHSLSIHVAVYSVDLLYLSAGIERTSWV